MRAKKAARWAFEPLACDRLLIRRFQTPQTVLERVNATEVCVIRQRRRLMR